MHSLARILTIRKLYTYNFCFWLLLLVLQSVQLYVYSVSFGQEFHFAQLIRFPLATCLAYWILSYGIFDLYLTTRRFSRKQFILFHILSAFVFGLVHKSLSYINGLLLERLFLPVESLNWRQLVSLWQTTLIDIVNPMAWYGFILGVLMALDYGQKFKNHMLQAQHLKNRLAEADLQGMKTQMQPHFLFNALNTIAMMVRKQKNSDAIIMISGLSEMLRNNLSKNKAQMVRLEEEMTLLNHYLTIEQARYQDKLQLEIDVASETLGKQVPNLILQPIVENAFKHGIAHSLGPATLKIQAYMDQDNLILSVFNTSDVVSQDWILAKNKGIGLKNTTDRLLQLYQGKAKFQVNEQEDGILVRIVIPAEKYLKQHIYPRKVY